MSTTTPVIEIIETTGREVTSRRPTARTVLVTIAATLIAVLIFVAAFIGVTQGSKVHIHGTVSPDVAGQHILRSWNQAAQIWTVHS